MLILEPVALDHTISWPGHFLAGFFPENRTAFEGPLYITADLRCSGT